MSVAIICTGTELLKGSCCNTNMRFAGAGLTANSLPPVLEISVGDHADELCHAISCALKSADILLISGGLGPTSDDITLAVTARFFGVKLVQNPQLRAKVEARWALRHRGHCPKFQYKQSEVVENGKIFDNPVGTASGIAFSTMYGSRMRHIYLLPGPPAEFETVFTTGVLPDILKLAGNQKHTCGFLACGIGEAAVSRICETVIASLPLEIAYTAGPYGTRVYLTGSDPELISSTIELLRQNIGKNALPAGCCDLPAAVIKKLADNNMTFGCAESCTGGIIADTTVSIPGVSTVFKGGIVAYANEVKNALLNVPREILQQYGAVSSECAAAMAAGACRALDCSCAVSTTGIAGPDGGTTEKPVGLVYIACCVNGLTAIKELHLSGNRQMIRDRAAAGAFQLLWEILDSPESEQLC